MKTQKILINAIGSLALTLAIIPAANAAATSGTATASVVVAVNVSQTRGLDFGTFTPDPAGDTITLTNAASTVRSAGSGSTTLLGTSEASGEFSISGTTGANVTISITGTSNLGGPAGMLFTPSAPSLGSPYTLTGTDNLYVGGTLAVPAATPSGIYSDANAYTVTVNYQ